MQGGKKVGSKRETMDKERQQRQQSTRIRFTVPSRKQRFFLCSCQFFFRFLSKWTPIQATGALAKVLAPWRRCRRARARLWNNHIRVAAFVRMNSFVKNAFHRGWPLTCLSKEDVSRTPPVCSLQAGPQPVRPIWRWRMRRLQVNLCVLYAQGEDNRNRGLCVSSLRHNQATRQLDFVSGACASLAIHH